MSPIRGTAFAILSAALLAAILAASTAQAAAVRDEVTVDLPAEIDKVIGIPERFAVEVPYSAGVLSHGTWTATGGTRNWRWEVHVPGAVSLSFHAAHAALPEGAALSVIGGGSEYNYEPGSVHRGELWSRIARGDTLTFTLTVKAADASAVVLDIVGLQVGFRTLGGGGPNHPHYDELRMQPQASGTATTCVENYQCHLTAGDTGPGQASALLVIANLGSCSGVLLNDVPGDGIPYMLTARHCENGSSDGGDPSAAGGITAYFDVTTPCGQPLGTVYSPGAAATTGAVTVVEQQDAWLVRLDGPLPVHDAYFAGWDASGATYVGGYTGHYGLGNPRQYTEWFGQAYLATVPGATLGVHYTSTLWELVNEIGSVAPGASGSGVFDPNNHLVGTVVRAVLQGTQPDSPGVCPLASPPAPGPSTATALATALTGIFDSTADPESTTGNVTLRTVLDRQNSGTLVVDGKWQPPQLSASSSTSTTGSLITLTWSAYGASRCTASGGESGDGWSGTLGTSGTVSGTEYAPGAITYVLTCIYGTRQSSAQAVVVWTQVLPTASLDAALGLAGIGYINKPISLSWASSVAPCVASGGAAGDGWAGAIASHGTKTVTESASGTYTYMITCGSGANIAIAKTLVTFQAFLTILTDYGISLVSVGQPITMNGASDGNSCSTSGGGPGDGWAGQNLASGVLMQLSESVPGTYTFTLTCQGGGQTASASLTITFIGGPPVVTLNLSSESPIVGQTLLMASWVSSVSPCTISISGYRSYSEPGNPQVQSWPDKEFVIGPYSYTVTCGPNGNTATATKTVNWVGTPTVTIAPPYSPVVLGTPMSVSWSGNITPCVASGGTVGDGWSGTALQPSGSLPVTESAPGTYSYVITCGTGGNTSQSHATVTVNPGPVFATLTASAATAPESGTPVTLTWNSNTSPCGVIDSYGYGWAGNDTADSGSAMVGERLPGPAIFYVVCGSGATTTAIAQVTINFTGPPRPSLSMSPPPSSVNVGQPFTLKWASADGSSCTGIGGGPTDGWAVARPASGSAQLLEPISGVYNFEIRCGISAPAILPGSEVYGNIGGPIPPQPTYSAGEVTIPTLIIGNGIYSNVSVPISALVSGPTGTTLSGNLAYYDTSAGQLNLPAVIVDGALYYNVVALAGEQVSIGGVSGADTYDSTNKRLMIPAVQVIGGLAYNNVVVTVGSVVTIGGGMPAAMSDQFTPASGQLLIPAVSVNGIVYTNVMIKVGTIVSVGS